MFIIKSEADERVMAAIEDIKAGCEVIDDYHEWEDVASSSISSILDDIDDTDEYDSTCSAFIRFIKNTIDENRNLALGVRAALIRAMKEGMDYLDYAVAADDEDPIVSVMKDTLSGLSLYIYVSDGTSKPVIHISTTITIWKFDLSCLNAASISTDRLSFLTPPR